MEPEAQDQEHFILHFLLTLKTRFMKSFGKFAALIGLAMAAFSQKNSTTMTIQASDKMLPEIGSPIRFSGGGQYPGGGNGRSRKSKTNRKHHSTRARNRARRK